MTDLHHSSRFVALVSLLSLLLLLLGCKRDDCATLSPRLELTVTSAAGFDGIDQLLLEIALGDGAARQMTIAPAELQRTTAGEARLVVVFDDAVNSATTAKVVIRAKRGNDVVAESRPIDVALDPDGCNFPAPISLGQDGPAGDAGPDGHDGGVDGGPRYLALAEEAADHEISGATAGGQLGTVVVLCDFNGDRLDDIVVAAPGAAGPLGAGLQPARGQVFLFASPHADLSRATPTVKVYGPSNGVRLGDALACGDLDGNGPDDVVIGAPGDKDGGSVYVLFGSNGLRKSFNLDPSAADHYAADITVTGETAQRLGASVAVVANPRMLLVGAPSHAGKLGDRDGAGAVFALAATDLSPGIALLVPSDATVSFWGAAEGEGLGSALTAGEFGGDDRSELALGAAGVGGAAAVRVFAGRDWPATPGDIDCGEVANPHLLVKVGVSLAEGPRLVAGDLTSDPHEALLVGAPTAYERAGEVYLLLVGDALDALGDSGTQTLDIGDKEYKAVYRGEPESLLGSALALVPSDGAGNFDLLLGAPGSDLERGVVYRLEGRSGYQPAEVISVANSADLRLRVTGAARDDRLGHSVAGGKLDDNSRGDVALGAPGSGDNAGRVYVVGGE